MYQFTYSGETTLGEHPERVKSNLAKAFNVKTTELDGVFSGELEFVRNNLERIEAEGYRTLFKRLGAVGEISESSPEQVSFHSVEKDTLTQSSQKQDQQKSSKNRIRAEIQLKKQNKNKGAAEPWLRYGGLAVVGTMIADTKLQSAQLVTQSGIDFGYLPLILAHIPLFIGCYLLAQQKKLPIFTRFFGLFSFAGLSALLLWPEGGTKHNKISLKAIAVTLFSCVLFSQWLDTAVSNSVDIANYAKEFEALSADRQTFPLGVLQSDSQIYMTEQREMHNAVKKLITQVKSGEFRPNQVSALTDQMMLSLANYIAWRQYQTFLHQQSGQKLPKGLQSDFQKQDEKLFKTLLNTVSPIDLPRMHEGITDWIAAPLNDKQVMSARRATSPLNQIYMSAQSAVFPQLIAPEQLRVKNWTKPKQLDLSKIRFPQIPEATLSTFENHIVYEFNTEWAKNKSLAVGFHLAPGKKTWDGKTTPPTPVMHILNNDVQAKYLPNMLNVFNNYK